MTNTNTDALAIANMLNARDRATTVDEIQWERDLVAGAEVVACWTCSYRSYAVRATVARVNAASVRVTLSSDVRAADGTLEYAAGRSFSVPLRTSARWSPSNAVFPVPAAR